MTAWTEGRQRTPVPDHGGFYVRSSILYWTRYSTGSQYRSNDTGVMCLFYEYGSETWQPSSEHAVLFAGMMLTHQTAEHQLRCHKGVDQGLGRFQGRAAPDVGDAHELCYGCLIYALDVVIYAEVLIHENAHVPC